jgi:DNA-binding NarL/FixJ family response regulator
VTEPQPAGAATIRVGVVDDHPSITAAVGDAIRAAPDLDLVGVGRSVEDGLALAPTVDVLVCDVQLDGRAEGLQLLELVHREARPPAVLLLSGFGQRSIVRAAIERGAAGYLDKGVELAVIIDAIRTVAGGGVVFSAAQLRSVGEAPRRPSARELQVIDLVASGATNAEVGLALGLSEKTVESHLRRVFDRYGVLSRTELVVLALGEGWVMRPSPAAG